MNNIILMPKTRRCKGGSFKIHSIRQIKLLRLDFERTFDRAIGDGQHILAFVMTGKVPAQHAYSVSFLNSTMYSFESLKLIDFPPKICSLVDVTGAAMDWQQNF